MNTAGKRCRRIPILIATGLVALAALAACGSGSNGTAAGGPANSPPVRLAVGIDGSYAPFYLADKTGMFKKAGLNVEIVQFGRGGDAVDALATGQIQLAGSSEVTTIGQVNQNPDLRALLVYEQSGKYLKVVARNGIDSVSQIKTMGIVPGLSQLSAIKLLQAKGIDPASVKFVSAGPPEIPALMQQGSIDAFVLWEPWPTKAVQLGGKVLMSTGEYNWSYVHWLITTSKWVTANEQVAGKIAAVIDAAAKQTEADPKAAAKATEDSVKLPQGDTLKAIDEIDFRVRDITPADVAGYESIAQFYVQTGAMKTPPQIVKNLELGWFSKNGKG